MKDKKSCSWKVGPAWCDHSKWGEDVFECPNKEAAMKLSRYLNEHDNSDVDEWGYKDPIARCFCIPAHSGQEGGK